MLTSLSTKCTAQSAWEGIKSCRVGVQRVRESNIEQLQKELSEIHFKDGESVNDFSMRITGLANANSITTLGGSIRETEIVKKMLQVVPDHLEQVAISIETLLDVNDLTVEEVTGRLCNVEQRKKNTASAVDKEGHLLLTEEEWLARLKLRDNTVESNGPSSSRKGGKKPWMSHGCTRGKDENQKKESTKGRLIQCSNCGKRGHLSRNCLLEQAQEQEEGRKGPCGSIRGGRASSLHGKCMRSPISISNLRRWR